MPEHLRALVVILALASVVFLFAKAPVTAIAMASGDFQRRRNLWFAVTLVAFFAHNFWVYIVAAASAVFVTARVDKNKLAMFFFLLFAVPPLSKEIPGIGGIRYFFDIDYVRLLALAVLLPAFLHLVTRDDVERFGRNLPDMLVAGYVVLNLLLMLQVSTFTGALRHGVFYAFIDVLLPYYVASRLVRNLSAFRECLMAFVIGALILSAIATFESAKHWLLYSSLEDALGVRWGYGIYLARGDESGPLRAQASTGHPIPLGYATAVAIGISLYLTRSIRNRLACGLGFALLLVGLIASLSRGPWLGAAAMFVVFVALGPFAVARLSMLMLAGAVLLPVVLAFPVGEKLLDYLPFVGTVDEGSVTYRQRLLEVSLQIMLNNPFFGAFDYIHSPAMQELKQGQGIIDIVNSYVAVGLSSGFIGLSLFAGFFLAVMASLLRSMRRLPNREDELYLLGRTVFAVLVGILVMIGTVSSISIIPAIYWSFAGLGLAYAHMLATATSAPAAAPSDLARTAMGCR